MRGPIVCALALLATAASAQPKEAKIRPARSLADCTSFDQQDKDDVTVDLTVHNSCSIPVDCTVSWKVVCAPQSKKRRSEHPESRKLALVEGTAGSTQASAAVCADDAWSIESIEWSCTPNKE
ncbi:MAG: hypothetical protein JO257_18305 [Deltaproteobacteria bacterium]|nr:hypothetical protein [Deltaproteobacteria bacterium]